MSTDQTQRPKVSVEHYGSVGRPAWQDVDWRAHQRWVEVGGRAVNVIDIGSGDRTIVCVHGLSGSWQNWLENIPRWAEAHRVIAMDLPGFGHSALPADGKVTISGYGRCLDALLGQLEVSGPVVLVGNSMGGFIGAEMGIAFGERLERLVLVSAAGLSVENLRNDHLMAGLYRIDELGRIGAAWLAGRSRTLSRRTRARQAMLSIVCAHPERLAPAFAYEQMLGSGKPGFIPALDALTSYPIRDRLEKIACPTLIVWGDKDRLVPPKDAYEFERRIPDSRVVMYQDTGHCAMFERPEHFNGLVLDFVSERVATSETDVAA